jgi:hypothetical protein
VEGRVYFKREPSGRAVVRAFRLPREADFDPAAARPDREAATGEDGTYRLRYLPDNDARFVLFGFIDTNGNGTLDAPGEVALALPDTILLTRAVPVVTDVDFMLIDPNEPAVVAGKVSNETGIDSVLVSVRIEAIADTTRSPQYARCDSSGAYEFKRVLGGDYVVRAFLDLRADSTCGEYACPDSTATTPCIEPCVVTPDTLRVAPGSAVKVPPLVLRRKESP